jgi:hypothetical protein
MKIILSEQYLNCLFLFLWPFLAEPLFSLSGIPFRKHRRRVLGGEVIASPSPKPHDEVTANEIIMKTSL